METNGRNSFILYTDMRQDINRLTMEQRGQLLTAVFEYASNTEQIPEIEDIAVGIVFDFWKRWLDKDAEKWKAQRDQRIEAGKASAEARKKKSERKRTPVDSVERDLTPVDSVAKNPTKRTVNVNVNVNDNVNVIEEETHKEEVSVVSVSDPVPQDEFAAIVSYYSAHIEIDMPPAVASQILSIMHDMDSAVIMEAMEEAVRRNAPRWPYIKSILNTWRGAGVKTIDDLDTYQTAGGRRNGRNHEADKPTVSKYDLPQLPGITVV